MRYLIAFLLLLHICMKGWSQRNGPLTIVQHKPISVAYTSAEDMLRQQVIGGAFELKTPASIASYRYYAQVVYAGNGAGVDRQIALKLAFTNSPSLRGGPAEIVLSTSPVLLFIQPGNPTPNNQQYSYIYDVIVKPFASMVRPEAYNFSIVFTATPE